MTRVPPRLLVVEDHEDNLDLIRLLLADLPLTMLEAGNGQEAIHLAITHQPDLILMDLSLPVLSGWEATRSLKANPATAGIPVIALSAHAMATDVARAVEAGCESYITKPIEIGAFRTLVATRLGLDASPL